MKSYLHVILYNFPKLRKTMLYDHKLVGPPDFPVGPLFSKYLGECFLQLSGSIREYFELIRLLPL